MAPKRHKRSGRRAGPFRACAGCRKRLPKGQGVRLVRGEDGSLLPDLFGKLPGRGVNLCPNFACFEQALLAQSLSRTLRAPVRVGDPAGLFAKITDSSIRQVRAILATALRCGWLHAGRTAVREALDKNQAAFVLLAEDAADSLRVDMEKRTANAKVPLLTLFRSAELASFHRGKPLAVLGIRHRGIARRLDAEVSKATMLMASMLPVNRKLPGELTVPSVRRRISRRRGDKSSAQS